MTSTKQSVVLLAEDDEDMRELIARRLAREGMRVVEVEDGFELRDYLELCRPGGDLAEPDVVVSDLNMPGDSGPQALEHFPNLRVPVVLISSCSGQKLRECGQRLKAAAVFEKPVNLDLLTRALRLAITGHEPVPAIV